MGGPPEAAEASENDKVSDLLKLFSRVHCENVQDCYLVCGGSVIGDKDTILRDTCISEGSNVLLVRECRPLLHESYSIFEALRTVADISIHATKSDNQDMPEYGIQLLEKFYKSLVSKDSTETWKPSSSDLNAIEKSVATLRNDKLSGSVPVVLWFGAYGCALIARRVVKKVHLSLVCLDEWRFKVQRGQKHRENSSTVGERGPTILYIGVVGLEYFDKIKLTLSDLLNGTKKMTEFLRNAAGKEQCNQKLPTIVQAILIDVIKEINDGAGTVTKLSAPRGGFTDVGIHTGEKWRNTSWPLLMAVVQADLEFSAGMELFHLFASHMYLRFSECAVWHLRQLVDASINNGGHEALVGTEPVGLKENVNCIMQVFELSVHKVPQFTGFGVPENSAEAFEGRSARLRYQLDEILLTYMEFLAHPFRLKKLTPEDFGLRNAMLHFPTVANEERKSHSFEQVSTRAMQNSEWLPLPPGSDATWEMLHDWLNIPMLQESEQESSAFLVCATIEHYFYEMIIADRRLKDAGNITLVESILDKYRTIANAVRRSQSSSAALSVELVSREVLTVWVAYCLVHRLSLHLFPALGNYDVTLNPNDLRYLVLSDKISIEAAFMVFKYLRENQGNGSPVFSLLQSDETFGFASVYAEKCPVIQKAWREEQEASSNREQKRWGKIIEKKESLRTLEEELREVQVELNSWEEEYANTVPFSSGDEENRRKRSWALRNLKKLRKKKNQKNKEIAHMEKAPSPIFQPLPSTKVLAMPILFFMFMPKCIQILSRLSFCAQQMLLPGQSEIIINALPHLQQRTINIDQDIKTEGPQTKWGHYYDVLSSGRCFSFPEFAKGTLILGSHVSAPLNASNNSWNPQSIRRISNCKDGVWYPNSLIPSIFWNGGGFALDCRRDTWFNPFLPVPETLRVQKFTERLPPKYQTMQWALEQHGRNSAPVRENIGEALQHQKPAWLNSKIEFMTFSALRAFPNQQMRKVCVALQEQVLPLDKTPVRILLQQTLYQLGDISLSDSGVVRRDLYRDMYEYRGWEAFAESLEKTVEKLQFKSRLHRAVRTIVELASFGSQWNSKCGEVARRFSNIVFNWSKRIETEEKLEKDSILVVEHRAKRCLFYLYSIICFMCGNLNSDDVSQICQASLLSGYMLASMGHTQYDDELKNVTIAAKRILARRLAEIINIIEIHPEVLTNAVKLIINTIPDDLTWANMITTKGAQTTVFEARTSDHLLHVNIQRGIFLFDGVAPKRLPKKILSHPLYKRTFAEINFEVVQDASGAFTTTSSASDYTYNFWLSNSTGVLHVRETSPDGTSELELCDGCDRMADEWGNDLPIRLRRMYSHWKCKTKHMIVLRPKLFSKRSIHFILYNDKECMFRSDSSLPKPSNEWNCFQVPTHRQNLDWTALDKIDVSTFDRLMVRDNAKSLRVLQKFEPHLDCIHTLLRSENTIILEFTRFGIEFQLSHDGHLLSNNFASFKLVASQQLNDTLCEFVQYLILEANGHTKIIVPTGKVNKQAGKVSIQIPNACDSDQMMYVYDVHPRFKTLEAAPGKLAVEARLQLASLYAATGFMLPEGRFKKTGGEIALELLRQSWVNRPLNAQENMHITSVVKFSAVEPSLALLSHEVECSSRQLDFLFGKESTECFPLDIDATTKYIMQKQCSRLNPRSFLSADEETFVLGHTISLKSRMHGVPHEGCLSVEICSSSLEGVQSIEKRMSLLLKEAQTERATYEPFPLKVEINDTLLGKEMYADMKRSWVTLQGLNTVLLSKNLAETKLMLDQLLGDCSLLRTGIERKIIIDVNNTPAHIGSHVTYFNTRRSVNLEPYICRSDLARIARSKNELLVFNPFLSKKALEMLYEGIMEWLQLCVIEDQLFRLCRLADSRNEGEIVRELCESHRTWSVKEHPDWLLFEVEQQIKIRRLQHAIAKFCIGNPGAITQLNMGEGKTRVILPMLILHFGNGTQVVRVHFLNPLLSEAYQYLHQTLTASILSRRIYLLPFNRDVPVDGRAAEDIFHCLNRCKETHGAVCVAPEHRLSLHLKWHELQLMGTDTECIQSELEKIAYIPYIDILDECDAILHHRYQLIYAVGSCVLLPAGRERWTAAQAVLYQVQHSPVVAELLSTAAGRKEGERKNNGILDGVRLITGPAFDEVREKLLLAIANGIFDNPPYHMRSLKEHPERATLIDFVSNRKRSLEWLKESTTLREETGKLQEALLSLRGMLAYGILEHCLTRRYRVDFGIDERRGRSHRVAVPFRACDTPADRAEYAQPDTLIVFTHLAYYHRGLSRIELREALHQLLKLGPIAQEEEYNIWLESARSLLSTRQLSAFDGAEKVDPSSEMQLDLLHAAYRYNMPAINFWLSNCVLPRETMQFRQRLAANAFFLAENSLGNVFGFSGTRDNRLLLPLQVRQQIPDYDEIRATDGKMLRVILQNDEVHFLPGSSKPSVAVIQLAVDTGVNALIDTGAAMAGLSNQEVAERLLQVLEGTNHSFKGVVYFDNMESTWMVHTGQGRSWPLGNAPVHEKDSFVYFDESRCRGADMKLRLDASALLTFGLMMCKDKLVQGAGRLRKLDCGQRLIFAVPHELASVISPAGEKMNSRLLLEWVLQNTLEATAHGIPEWGKQAGYFYASRDPRARLVEENITVEELYSNDIFEQQIDLVVKSSQVSEEGRLRDLGITIKEEDSVSMEQVLSHAKTYGADRVILSTGLDEECEREVEQERELEKEEEREVPRRIPETPREWNFKELLIAKEPEDLPESADVMRISEAMERLFRNSELEKISWEKSEIYLTGNFMRTVSDSTGSTSVDLGDYMRPVDVIIIFEGGGKCLLLSEWEADEILALDWKYDYGRSREKGPSFVNLAYLLEASKSDSTPVRMRIGIGNKCNTSSTLSVGSCILSIGISEVTLAALQLLAGHTMYGTDARKEAVLSLIPDLESRKAALRLVELRGLGHMIPRSDLEKLADVLTCQVTAGKC